MVRDQTYHLKKTTTTTIFSTATPETKEAEAPHDGDDDVDTQVAAAAARYPPGGAEAVILYTTSLRSIRKTFRGLPLDPVPAADLQGGVPGA
ncbi:unnamed protein product [Linum trigynum]|uniref:Uncharacterized protein n=1 Tax=Linum trigynum TaxID=586398 RepID=A0AAV2DFA6_9ROSI